MSRDYWLPGDILSDDAYFDHYGDDWCGLDDDDCDCADDEVTLLILVDWDDDQDDFDAIDQFETDEALLRAQSE